MRHVIIEGPDGAGKTTLARRLCESYQLAYHHEGPPPADDVVGHYARLLIHTNVPTLFDRLYLGELVYGPLLRGRCGLSRFEVRRLHNIVRMTDSRIIICFPPKAVCLANNLLKDEFITDAHLRELAWDRWAQTAATRIPNLRRYDYTQEPHFVL